MLSLKNIAYSYSPEKAIFTNLNFVVNQGEFIIVAGENGCGKSTLFNIISGAIKPQYGTIEIDNINVTNWQEHKRAYLVAKVWQDTTRGSIDSMSIMENLSLAYMRGKNRSLKQFDSKQNRTLFKEQLMQLNMGLEDRLDCQVSTLSGGQRQAVSVLMAYLSPAKLILLDEITAALDTKSSEQILKFVTSASPSKSTLMISHNPDHYALASKVITLKDNDIRN